MSSVPEEAVQSLPVIQVNHEQVHKHLDQVVRASVEQTLNALLDAEADELCGAQRYQRSPDRLDTRAGHYSRTLHTKAGEVTLNVPWRAVGLPGLALPGHRLQSLVQQCAMTGCPLIPAGAA